MHSSGPSNMLMVVVTIFFTALCWGSYGPLLQWGHGDMGSGRLRPFICVGIAYFFVAIVGPLLLMLVLGQEKGEGLFSGWTTTGIFWSLAGGAAGALGAFGIILALNYGGTPTFVMPLVFGTAPVINTFIMLTVNKKWGEISPFFAAGLILVAAGAVTVLLTAPKGAPPKAKTAAAKSAKGALAGRMPTTQEKAANPYTAPAVAGEAGEEDRDDIDAPRANS